MIVEIAHRFRGPRSSANGGYTAGLLAEAVATAESAGAARDAAQALTIRLRSPPPLDVPLAVVAEPTGYRLRCDGNDRPIAEAEWQPFPLREVPQAVELTKARLAESRSLAWDASRFDHCFVCGSGRPAGDGLRIFAGPVDVSPDNPAGRCVATVWQPDESLAENGRIPARIVWSALDCPGYFAVVAAREYLLLAQMSAQVYELPRPGDTLIVQAWPLGQERRSRFAGTALFTAAGRLLAAGHTRWMPPREPSAAPPGAQQLQHTQRT